MSDAQIESLRFRLNLLEDKVKILKDVVEIQEEQINWLTESIEMIPILDTVDKEDKILRKVKKN
ncbi:MAG: hypothetical protein V1850_00345 [Candidatus Bathyarchaeota archaeon]